MARARNAFAGRADVAKDKRERSRAPEVVCFQRDQAADIVMASTGFILHSVLLPVSFVRYEAMQLTWQLTLHSIWSRTLYASGSELYFLWRNCSKQWEVETRRAPDLIQI